MAWLEGEMSSEGLVGMIKSERELDDEGWGGG